VNTGGHAPLRFVSSRQIHVHSRPGYNYSSRRVPLPPSAMHATLVRRALGNLIPPKIATPSSVATGGSSTSTASVVDFYSKLPKGPLQASAVSGIRARYFDGKNASGKPIVAFIGGMLLFGYTLDYHMHLKHHKNHQH